MGQEQRRTDAVAMMTAVNASEMRISSNPVETLVAFSIGSGVGVTIFDPTCGVGGVMNFLLPDSSQANGVNPEKLPLMFADTGLPFFFKSLFEQGVQPDSMKVVIAGGAHIMDQVGIFNIGQQNCRFSVWPRAKQ